VDLEYGWIGAPRGNRNVVGKIGTGRGSPGYRFHGLPFWLIRLGHSFMQREQLLGIARRVEAGESRVA
jgi:hypothetical protein